MENSDEEVSEERIMSRSQIKMLIKERLNYETEFQIGRTKKGVLWNNILKKVIEKDPTFLFSKNDIITKFSNCLTTYKRIKKRYEETGKSSTTWEFFDNFDEVYGTSHFIDPSESLILSLDEPDNKLNLNSISAVEIDSNLDNHNLDSEIFYEDEPRPKKKKTTSDIVEVLKYEAAQADRHHNELMAVERERIKVLREIKELMEKFLNN